MNYSAVAALDCIFEQYCVALEIEDGEETDIGDQQDPLTMLCTIAALVKQEPLLHADEKTERMGFGDCWMNVVSVPIHERIGDDLWSRICNRKAGTLKLKILMEYPPILFNPLNSEFEKVFECDFD